MIVVCTGYVCFSKENNNSFLIIFNQDSDVYTGLERV